MAKAGATLERFYVCPVCSPTRAEFLTGRYHQRGGVVGVSTGGERLNLEEKTIADTFKAAGYKTGAFGKWHNGTQYPYHPNGRGFEEFYGFCSGHWGDYFSPPLEHNGKLTQGAGFITDDLTDHAIAFIEHNKERPFFCYLPFNTPHSPMQVPDKFYKKFADFQPPLKADGKEDVAMTGAALEMCENIDWNVGRLLQRLDDLKLSENTIVIYFSDNGPNSFRWNGGMKGRKGSTDDGGVRSPFFIRWPGQIPAGSRIPQIAGAIDLLPTLIDLAGVSRLKSAPLDGISLKAALRSGSQEKPERLIFSHWDKRYSVRTQRYRLDQAGELFDMETDPGQRAAVTKQQPELARSLSQEVARFAKEVGVTKNNNNRPYTVGYREFPVTQLPARDGIASGGIKRSAAAPNCSFFTNWKNIDDVISWDIEVASAGKYAVQVYYSCAQADVGSTVELAFMGHRTQTIVAEANDPPLLGAQNDRVPRHGESYVKDFKPLELGVLDLPAGHDTLTLRALKMPGTQVMDMRLMVLTLLE